MTMSLLGEGARARYDRELARIAKASLFMDHEEKNEKTAEGSAPGPGGRRRKGAR